MLFGSRWKRAGVPTTPLRTRGTATHLHSYGKPEMAERMAGQEYARTAGPFQPP